MKQQPSFSKPPRSIWENIFAFSPNRDTLGATSYFIVDNQANILIDSPSWDETTAEFLQERGGVKWLFITHRGGIGKAEKIQQALGCDILIQEQEAYLLPESRLVTFQYEQELSDRSVVFWTPGHSPGSSCLYYSGYGGILFAGRHLLPNLQGQPLPLRTAKTFHWPRQIKSVRSLVERFSPQTLRYICPGANTGALRGDRFIDDAYQKLANLDFDVCLETQPLL